MDTPIVQRPPCRPARLGLAGGDLQCPVSLTLAINGVAYDVQPLATAERSFGIVRAFRLRRRDTGRSYDVAQHADHQTCTCGDFTWRRADRDPDGCKHCRALAAVGLFRAAPQERPSPRLLPRSERVRDELDD